MEGVFTMKEKQLEVEDKPLIYVPPKKRTIFFAIMYGLFVIDFISRVGINAIFPVVQADLGLSDMEVGMMGQCCVVRDGYSCAAGTFLVRSTQLKSHQFVRTGMECRYVAFRYGQ